MSKRALSPNAEKSSSKRTTPSKDSSMVQPEMSEDEKMARMLQDEENANSNPAANLMASISSSGPSNDDKVAKIRQMMQAKKAAKKQEEKAAKPVPAAIATELQPQLNADEPLAKKVQEAFNAESNQAANVVANLTSGPSNEDKLAAIRKMMAESKAKKLAETAVKRAPVAIPATSKPELSADEIFAMKLQAEFDAEVGNNVPSPTKMQGPIITPTTTPLLGPTLSADELLAKKLQEEFDAENNKAVISPRANSAPTNIAELMGKLPKNVKQNILSKSIEDNVAGTSKTEQDKTAALVDALTKVQMEPEQKQPVLKLRPKLNNPEAQEKLDRFVAEGTCYGMKREGKWWKYWPDGSRVPFIDNIPNPLMYLGLHGGISYEFQKDRPDDEVMPFYIPFRRRPRSAFRTQHEFENQWTPPKPAPEPRPYIPKSLPVGYTPDCGNIQYIHREKRMDMWFCSIGVAQIFHKNGNKPEVLCYHNISMAAFTGVSTVAHRVCYDSATGKNMRCPSKYVFHGVTVSGIKLACQFIEDMYLNEEVPKEPQIPPLYDAMDLYLGGCGMGLDSYLGPLRERICKEIVQTMYEVDRRNTIQSVGFLALAIKLHTMSNKAPGVYSHAKDPIWICVVANAVKLRKEGKFRDPRLQDQMAESFPQLEAAMVMLEKEETAQALVEKVRAQNQQKGVKLIGCKDEYTTVAAAGVPLPESPKTETLSNWLSEL